MYKVMLDIGNLNFHANDCIPPITLNRYMPEAEVEEITPTLQAGIEQGLIHIMDLSAPDAEDTSEQEPNDGFNDNPEEAIAKGGRPTSEQRCEAKTKSGSRCKNKALLHSKHCSKHITPEELTIVDTKLAEG